jgi:hypothetical protein
LQDQLRLASFRFRAHKPDHASNQAGCYTISSERETPECARSEWFDAPGAAYYELEPLNGRPAPLDAALMTIREGSS